MIADLSLEVTAREVKFVFFLKFDLSCQNSN